MTRIAILVHREQAFEASNYYLRDIAAIWREQGYEVAVVHGTDRSATADVAILHIDLTVVPDAYTACVADYPVVINAAVRDISKRAISGQCVTRGDGYSGPVLVKSNLNCGGLPELDLARCGPRPGRWAADLRRRLPWTLRGTLKTHDYRVYQDVAEVPRTVWHNPALVVEQFLPERDGALYCLRTWTFLGDAHTHSRSWSPDPVIKSRNVVRREVLHQVPDALWALRETLGFGYGKFDYVVHDGRVVLFDANRTPGLGDVPRAVIQPNARILAGGIRTYLRMGA